MSKCVEKVSNRPGPMGFGNAIDYACPVCGHVTQSKEGCYSHIYRKHREWAHKDTNRLLE